MRERQMFNYLSARVSERPVCKMHTLYNYDQNQVLFAFNDKD